MDEQRYYIFWKILTYYPLFLICANTLLNSLILVILCKKKFFQRPTTHYMRAIAIVDIFMMYGWNFDHFLDYQFGFELDRLTVWTCKIFMYYNHCFNQMSAWLRVWLCVDRFRTLHQVRKCQTMARHRQALIIIVVTIVFIALFNLHLPILSCYSHTNGTKISAQSLHFKVYPMWSYVNLCVYNLLPFLIMFILSMKVIQYLIIIKRTSTIRHSRIQHRSISTFMFLSVVLFVIMTTPSTVIFMFSSAQFKSPALRSLLVAFVDCIQYTYHSLAFLLYFITLIEFRTEFYRLLCCCSMPKHRSSHTSRTKQQVENQYRVNSITLTAMSRKY
jgi:hypothetical protein